jgi:hypothetical protein
MMPSAENSYIFCTVWVNLGFTYHHGHKVITNWKVGHPAETPCLRAFLYFAYYLFLQCSILTLLIYIHWRGQAGETEPVTERFEICHSCFVSSPNHFINITSFCIPFILKDKTSVEEVLSQCQMHVTVTLLPSEYVNTLESHNCIFHQCTFTFVMFKFDGSQPCSTKFDIYTLFALIHYIDSVERSLVDGTQVLPLLQSPTGLSGWFYWAQSICCWQKLSLPTFITRLCAGRY